METIDAPRARINLYYNDVDISADIAPMLVSFEYNDYASGQVDDIQVTLKDPDDRWCHDWYPDEGAKLRAEIVWIENNVSKSLPCGVFVIDSPSYASPGIITLKTTAASVTTSLRRQKKTRQWQHISLKELASKIASEQGVSIFFEGSDTPALSKIEQKDESDLAFLLRQCQRNGYTLSVDTSKSAKANQLVIRKRDDADAESATVIIERRGGIVESWSFSTESLETYRSCQVKYKHPDKKLLTYTYIPSNAPETGQILTVREHVGNLAEAERLAKSKLELANRDRVTCDMQCVGSFDLLAGRIATLSGWGVLDGRYAIDEATHTVSPAYKTRLKLVRIFT